MVWNGNSNNMKTVIIGAGLLGISTAYHLARQGVAVTVIERESGPALGASFANGAILTPSMADPWNSPGIWRMLMKYLGREDSPFLLRPRVLPSLAFWGIHFLRNSGEAAFLRNTRANARLATYSLKVQDELRAELNIAFDSGPGGTLKITRDPVSFDRLVVLAAALGEVGVVSERLDAAGVVAREPALEPIGHELAGGLLYPDDQSGDARMFALGLADAAAGLGVTFHYDTAVQGFDIDGDRVAAVRSDKGRHSADAVVIAGGSHSPALGRQLRLRLPVKPVKGYSITVPVDGWEAGPRLPLVDDNYHAVITPLGSRLRVAGTAEFTGFDARVTPGRIDNLVNMLLAVYPRFVPYLDRGNISPWTGFRPMSCDGVPIIGATRLANVHVNTGHGHLGWTMSAGSGRLLADLMLGREPEIDPAPYRISRF